MTLVKAFSVVGLVIVVITATTVVSISLGTTMQTLVPGHLLGRVAGVMGTMCMAAMPIGQMIFGSALDFIPPFGITAIYAILVLTSGILAFVGFGRLRKLNKLNIGTETETATEAKALETEALEAEA